MIPKGLFAQLAILLVSVGIIFTYIKPTFESIGETQDAISVYQIERDKVSFVNDQLATQLASVNNISSTDMRDLLTYMPSTVDEISVMRDLQSISQQAGVIFQSVTYDGVKDSIVAVQAESDEMTDPYMHQFTITFEGVYDATKNFFELIEKNKYPLEVVTFNVQSNEGGFLSTQVTIATYSHTAPLKDALEN